MTLPRRLPDAATTNSYSVAQTSSLRTGRGQFRRLLAAPVVVACLLWPPLLLIALGVVGVVLVVRRHRSRAARAREARAAARQLPAAVSLLQLVLAAGHPPRHAIGIVGSFGDGSVARRFADVASKLRAGASFAEAIDDIDAHLDDIDAQLDGVARTLRVLELGERHGQAISMQLHALVDDVQRERIARIDEQSQRLAVHMLFPLVLCILPAFLLLSMLPLLVALLDGLT